ncbi:large subunit ribosomal protein L31 [Entomoplasma freundtii]|uniref:Large ribosomal subunit protein bL31 n=1 Tax=Entomoplasma freundtii TaxID=74700 RepID=A0A2K8NQP9_9MOLU|nr:50S ribosomal protein L31 [Entomoplasma freundtii]ATZ16114.1 50S ribosomal protein L31 [Entomoplasma freundtii]TDY56985.1 large subunit ribosomal protein L31 [Entomoplasma freundtii]
MPKKDIHPRYWDDAKFVCTTCENVTISGSTKGQEVRLDICSNCHPFYTGNQQFANTAGRAEQFKAKFAKKDSLHANVAKASAEQKAKNVAKKK